MSKFSMTKGWCLFITLPLVPIAIILVLVFALPVPKGPSCYINELYVPAFDLSLRGDITGSSYSSATRGNNIVNPSLFIDLALRNGMKNYAVSYGNINLTISYNGNEVASYVVPSFFQGRKVITFRQQVVQTQGIPWDGPLGELYNGSKVVFRVDLTTRARFYLWDSQTGLWGKRKTNNVRVGTEVEVDGSGMKARKGFVKLNSAA